MPEQYNRFRSILLDFAVKMGKENPEEYVSSGGCKARQGGAGIELINIQVKHPKAKDIGHFAF